MAECCVPGRPPGRPEGSSTPPPLDLRSAATVDRAEQPGRLSQVPGGDYSLGDHFDEGYAADGEGPVRAVTLNAFEMGVTTVTNAEFAAFVEATGHRTTAEVEGSSAVFHLMVRAPRSAVVGHSPQTPWWVGVRGADWVHPAGPWSDLEGLSDHPVVHVSHSDALAYCAWAGRRLPSEAEWESAARGGLVGARFPWGGDLEPDDSHVCNVFQGDFPVYDAAADGWAGTAPVDSFPPNGYGLRQVVGNVWEWCGDWFSPEPLASRSGRDPRGPRTGTTRVIRGGSFLCHASYCHRYRVSARSAAPPDSGASNLGFRCAA